MFFIFAWNGPNQDDSSFEENVPLLFLGKHLRQRRSDQSFHVIFLDGYDRLSTEYLSKLKSVDLNLVDFSSEFRRLARAFPCLARFGTYELLCFLRWPALRQYLKQENITKQVFHIDGDLIFNAFPQEIAADLAGLTFVLQGCPAFVSITRHDWLDQYCDELAKLERDVEGYSARAWQERMGWEESHQTKWAGSRFRQVISSDQDLLSHLIHTGRIFQDSPLDFVGRLQLFYAENPLYFHSHAKIQLRRQLGLNFMSDGNRCSVDDKRIAFWHFQTYFVRYVSDALALREIHYPFRFPNSLESRWWQKLWSIVHKKGRISRRAAYSCFQELNPGKSEACLSFANIFNRRSYWKKGVFSNANPELNT
jgi:hypothetical protein